MNVVIVGAGLSGLLAARTLQESGHDVTVFDKGRSPGGRLATRRVGGARIDHGAQFFTVRTPAFAAEVDRWTAAGLAHEWCRGFSTEGDGFPRYAVRGGMSTLAKHLAAGLEVRCNSLVFAVRPGDGQWEVALDDGTSVPADALIVTCPLPQTYALLVSSGVEFPAELRQTEYDRTISLLVALDGPGAIPAPGARQHPDDTFSFIADNVAKGASEAPGLTFHANPAWSDANWERDTAALGADLLERAAPWIGGATVLETSVKKWRFATPRVIWPEPYWRNDAGPAPLVVAGDAFAGPRMEGAALSGLAAAASLASMS
jgi:hypothetical protein